MLFLGLSQTYNGEIFNKSSVLVKACEYFRKELDHRYLTGSKV